MDGRRTCVGLLAGMVAMSAAAAPTVRYEECQEPFTYASVSYLGTTNKHNTGTQWCYLKQPRDGWQWANVDTSTVPTRRTKTGEQCRAVTRIGSESIMGCSTSGQSTPWCHVADGRRLECAAPAPQPLPRHTLPIAGAPVSSIAFGSCWHTGPAADRAVQRLASQRPDLFLWLGDNVYADTTDMQLMRSKYDAKKTTASYRDFLATGIPVMATWDDHDLGLNNAGSNYTMRAESQIEFLRHFDAVPNDPRYAGQRGIYNAQLFGDAASRNRVRVIMLDARYHRSPTFTTHGTCQGDASDFLGTEQWNWLAAELEKEAEVTVIGTGIQVLPPLHRGRAKTEYCAYGNGTAFNQAIASLDESNLPSGTVYESWAEIPQKRERLLRLVQSAINRGRTKAVVFVSGDQHWGEIMRKEIPASATHGAAVVVHEVTASGFEQNWPYRVDNANRMPVYADAQGTGSYTRRCLFPYKYAGVEYLGCTTRDHTRPWCYYERDASGAGVAGQWGNCAGAGAETPAGLVAALSPNHAALSTNDYFLVNQSASNYGRIEIDWSRRELRLSLQTEAEEAVAAVVRY